MRFSPYARRRQTAVEWLATVPGHWQTLSLARVTLARCDGPFGSGLKSEHYTDSGVRVVRLNNIKAGAFDDADHAFIEKAYCRTLGDHDVLPGDVLVAGLGDDNNPVGRACAVPTFLGPAIVKADCFRFRVDGCKVDATFLALQLTSSALALNGALASGTTRSRMSLLETARRIVAIPPVPEQRTIVGFLGARTAKMDALAAKKQKLLDRLKEKRSALISRTVSRGLAPDDARPAGLRSRPELRPSGTGWIGDVPAHWESGCLRRYAQMRTGHTPSRTEPEYWDDCDIPWFTLGDVWQLRDGRQMYLGDTAERISRLGLANSAAELLPAGTVVFSRTASVGFSGIMPIPMATSQDFWNWVPGPKLLSEYLLYLFRSMRQEFERLTMGSTHKTIYQPDAARLAVCVPPIQEQRAIVEYLNDQTTRIDQLITKVQAAIERVQEYRSALITAAVTGQIDVRESGTPGLPAAAGSG